MYLETLENAEEQSKEPYKAWGTRMVGVENSISSRICKASPLWRCSNSNKRLADFGLISMLDYYTERCVTCKVDRTAVYQTVRTVV